MVLEVLLEEIVFEQRQLSEGERHGEIPGGVARENELQLSSHLACDHGQGRPLSPQGSHLRLRLISTTNGGGKSSRISWSLMVKGGNRLCSKNTRDGGRPSQRQGLLLQFCCGVGFGPHPDELCEVSGGIFQVQGFSSQMDCVLECKWPNSAEMTWKKCLNTDYFQRLMNSVLQQVVP